MPRRPPRGLEDALEGGVEAPEHGELRLRDAGGGPDTHLGAHAHRLADVTLEAVRQDELGLGDGAVLGARDGDLRGELQVVDRVGASHEVVVGKGPADRAREGHDLGVLGVGDGADDAGVGGEGGLAVLLGRVLVAGREVQDVAVEHGDDLGELAAVGHALRRDLGRPAHAGEDALVHAPAHAGAGPRGDLPRVGEGVELVLVARGVDALEARVGRGEGREHLARERIVGAEAVGARVARGDFRGARPGHGLGVVRAGRDVVERGGGHVGLAGHAPQHGDGLRAGDLFIGGKAAVVVAHDQAVLHGVAQGAVGGKPLVARDVGEAQVAVVGVDLGRGLGEDGGQGDVGIRHGEGAGVAAAGKGDGLARGVSGRDGRELVALAGRKGDGDLVAGERALAAQGHGAAVGLCGRDLVRGRGDEGGAQADVGVRHDEGAGVAGAGELEVLLGQAVVGGDAAELVALVRLDGEGDGLPHLLRGLGAHGHGAVLDRALVRVELRVAALVLQLDVHGDVRGGHGEGVRVARAGDGDLGSVGGGDGDAVVGDVVEVVRRDGDGDLGALDGGGGAHADRAVVDVGHVDGVGLRGLELVAVLVEELLELGDGVGLGALGAEGEGLLVGAVVVLAHGRGVAGARNGVLGVDDVEVVTDLLIELRIVGVLPGIVDGVVEALACCDAAVNLGAEGVAGVRLPDSLLVVVPLDKGPAHRGTVPRQVLSDAKLLGDRMGVGADGAVVLVVRRPCGRDLRVRHHQRVDPQLGDPVCPAEGVALLDDVDRGAHGVDVEGAARGRAVVKRLLEVLLAGGARDALAVGDLCGIGGADVLEEARGAVAVLVGVDGDLRIEVRTLDHGQVNLVVALVFGERRQGDGKHRGSRKTAQETAQRPSRILFQHDLLPSRAGRAEGSPTPIPLLGAS